MAGNAGTLVVELEINDQDFKVKIHNAQRLMRQLSRAAQQSGSAAQRAHRHVTSFGAAFRDLTLTVGLARHALQNMHLVTTNLFLQVAKASGEIERLTILMQGLSKETDTALRVLDAEKNVKWLLDMAQNMPFQIKELAGGMAKFKAVGLDPMTEGFTALADSVARFGGDSQVFHRATVAIQQMAGKGIISMEELRQQLGEAVPDAIKQMSRAMGLTMGELVDQISKGQVHADNLRRLFVVMEASSGGAGQRLMETWGGQLQRLKTRWDLFLAQIGNVDQGEGIFGGLKDEVRRLSDFLASKEATYWAKEIAEVMKTMLVAGRETVNFFIVNWPAVEKALIALAGLAAWKVLLSIGTTVGNLFAWIAGKGQLLIRVLQGLGSAAAILGNLWLPLRALIAIGGIGATMFPEETMALLEKGGGKLKELTGDVDLLGDTWNWVASDVESAMARIEKSIGAAAHAKDLDDLKRYSETLGTDLLDAQAEFEKAFKRNARIQGSGDQMLILGQQGQAAKQRLEDAQAEVNRLQAEIFRVNNAIGLAVDGLTEKVATAYGEEIRTKVAKDIAQFAGIVNNAASQLDAELAAAFEIKDQTKREEAQSVARQKYMAATTEAYGKQIKYVTDLRTTLEGQLASMDSTDERYRALTYAIIQLTEQENDLIMKQSQFNSVLGETPTKVNSADKAHAQLMTKWEGRLQSYMNKQADALGEMAGEEGGLAKLMSELNNPNGPWKELTDESQRQALINWADAADKAAAAVKKWREDNEAFSDANDTINNLFLTQQEYLHRVNEEYDSANGKVPIYSANMRGLQNQLAKVRDELWQLAETTNKDVIPALEKLDQIEAGAWGAEVTKLTAELKSGAKEMGNELETAKIRLKATFDLDVEFMRKRIEALAEHTEERKELEEAYAEWLAARQAQLARDMETPLGQMAREYEDMTDKVQGVFADTFKKMEDAIVEFVKTGKFEFSDLIDFMLEELLRLAVQKTIIGPLSGAMDSVIGSLIGGFAGGSGGVDIGAMFGNGGFSPSFAMGGIMTKKGALELRKYAQGGIATSPQLALYGEGSMNEAFVPLPDGRRIPVAMEGSAAPPVTVNVINQTGQNVNAEQSQPRMDAGQMVLDVVLKAANQPGGFRDGLRGALR